jgi:hypothetical protein
LFTTLPVHKTVLTTVKCAVVSLRVLMTWQSARLITKPPIELTLDMTPAVDPSTSDVSVE